MRCPDDETPSQGRLVSIFLEGLRNKKLHAHLYAKKHTQFNECCFDAMDYDDNFDISSNSSPKVGESREKSTLESSAITSTELIAEQIADTVLKRIEHLFPIHREESHSQARLLEQPRHQWMHREPTRPVMETHPLTLGTRSLGDIGTRSFKRRVEPSSFQPYHRAREPSRTEPFYENRTYPLSQENSKSAHLSMFMASQANHVNEQEETVMATCIDCGVDHWAMDCPHRQVPTQQPEEINTPFWPIERYCVGCCEEHFPKDCSLRPREDKGKGKMPLLYASVVPSPLTSQDENETIPLRVITRAQTREKCADTDG